MDGWADTSSARVLLIILPAAIGPGGRDHKPPPQIINTAVGAQLTADLILLIMLMSWPQRAASVVLHQVLHFVLISGAGEVSEGAESDKLSLTEVAFCHMHVWI